MIFRFMAVLTFRGAHRCLRNLCSAIGPVSRNCYRPGRSICAWRCVLIGGGGDMDTGPKIAQVAALVGDPARANMLSALMDGRTRTATELAHLSGVAPQTASG